MDNENLQWASYSSTASDFMGFGRVLINIYYAHTTLNVVYIRF